MDLFSLVASLTLDSSGFDSGTKDAESKASSLGSKIKGAMAVGGAAIAAVTGATVALTKGLFDGAKQVSDYGDHIDKASQKLGLSAQAFQEWDAILQYNGSSADALAGPMRTLSNLATEGSAAFEQLGLSQEQVASMSKEELFEATIAGLQGIGDEGERARLATELMGRGAMELMPLLNTTAEDTEALRQHVHELGGVMSDESVKAAATFNDSLSDLQTAFGSLKRGLTSDFMPGITTVMDGLTKIFSGDSDSGVALINEGIDNVLSTMNENLPKFLETGVAILGGLMDAFIQNLPKLLEMGAKLLGQLIAGLLSNIPTLLASVPEIIKAIVKGLMAAWPSIRDAGKDIVTMVGDGIKTMLDKAKTWGSDLIQNFIDGLKAKFERLRDTVSNAAGIVKRILGFSEPEEGPLSNFHTFAPDMMDLFTKGIKEGEGQLRRELGTVSGMIANAWSADGSPSYTVAGAGAMSMALPVESETKVINIDLTAVLDGAVVARNQYRYNTKEANRVGVPLVQGGY